MENKTQNIPGLVLGQDQNPYDTKKILLDYNEYKSLLEVSNKLKETKEKMEETISYRVKNERDKIESEYDAKLAKEKREYYQKLIDYDDEQEEKQKNINKDYQIRIRNEWDKAYDTSKEQIEERKARMLSYKQNILDSVNEYKKRCDDYISNISFRDRVFNWGEIQLPKIDDSGLLKWGEFKFGDVVSCLKEHMAYIGVIIDSELGKDGKNKYTIFFPEETPYSGHLFNSSENNLKHEWYGKRYVLENIEKFGYKLDYADKKLIKL